jgi:hypothetical protein
LGGGIEGLQAMLQVPNLHFDPLGLHLGQRGPGFDLFGKSVDLLGALNGLCMVGRHLGSDILDNLVQNVLPVANLGHLCLQQPHPHGEALLGIFDARQVGLCISQPACLFPKLGGNFMMECRKPMVCGLGILPDIGHRPLNVPNLMMKLLNFAIHLPIPTFHKLEVPTELPTDFFSFSPQVSKACSSRPHLMTQLGEGIMNHLGQPPHLGRNVGHSRSQDLLRSRSRSQDLLGHLQREVRGTRGLHGTPR